MARTKSRKNPSREGAGLSAADWKQLAPAGGLVAVVVLTLIAGAVLQSGEERLDDPGVPTRLGAETAEPPTEAAVSKAAPSPPPPSPGVNLRDRSETDFRRLAPHRSKWTLQLMVACDPANAEKMLARTGDSADLYVVPFDYKGLACYRVCWGVYTSRDEAAAARDLPAEVRASVDSPKPQTVAVVAP